jgi:hypothetical protein
LSFLQTLIRAASLNPPGDTINAATAVLSFLIDHGCPAESIAPEHHIPNVVTDFQAETHQEIA